MPSVTSQSSRATSTARRTAARERGPGRRSRGRRRTSPSPRRGRRRSSSGGGQPDRGHRVARRRLGDHRVRGRARRAGRRTASRCADPVTTTTGRRRAAPAGRRCSWSSDRPLPVRSCRNFGDDDARQRPQPGAGAAGRDHGPEVLDVRRARSAWWHCRATPTLACDDHLRDGPGAPAARRRRPAARHVLRPRHRRADRAVGDDVRQLGRQDRVAARRGARPRARPDDPDRPADALAGPGLPRRRLDGRAGGRRRTTTADAVVCGPDGLDRWAERAADVPVLACALHPLGVRFAEPLPAGVHDFGVEVWSQPDAFVAVRPARARRPGAGRWHHPARAVGRGRRRESPRRRRPPPHRGEPGFPFRDSPPSPSRSLAAARWSWSPTRTRGGSRRRTPPSAPRPASPER